MYRYLLHFTIGLIAGIAVCVGFAVPALALKIALILWLIATLIVAARYKQPVMCIVFVGFIVGGVYGTYKNNIEIRPMYQYCGKQVSGTMLVTSVDSVYDKWCSGECTVSEINGKKLSEKIKVSFYGDKRPALNDIVRFKKMSVSTFEAKDNDKELDYPLYERSNGIFFCGKVDSEEFTITGKGGKFPFRQARELNRIISERIDFVCVNKDVSSILKGIFLGNKSSMTEELKNWFKTAGIYHILAVSGMHVVIIASFIYILLYGIRIRRKFKNIIVIVFVLIFVLITGIPVSAVRAAMLVIMTAICELTLQDYDGITILSFAALLQLAVNPLAVFDMSFQLSFTAAAGIITMSKPISERLKFLPHWLSDVIAVSVSAQVGTAAVTASMFGTFSLYSIIGNIIAVPLLPYIYVLGVVAVVTNLKAVVFLNNSVIKFLVKVVSIISALPKSIINHPINAFVIAGIIIAVCALMYLGLRRRHYKVVIPVLVVGIIIAAYGLLLPVAAIPTDTVDVTFISVGQGDSCLIEMPDGKKILLDTGTEKECENSVMPYLKKSGIKNIDKLIISHIHDDHDGGAIQIIQNFKVDEVLFPDSQNTNSKYKKIVSCCGMEKIKYDYLSAGEEFSYGDVKFLVLSPKADCYESNYNNTSVVIRMDYGESSYLFTGDAEKKIEEELSDMDVDVLKVGHHGSKTSTNEEILNKITPEISVVSVGKNNKYNLPDKVVMSTLKKYGGKVYRTDEDGMIKLKSNIKGQHTVETVK